MAKYASYYAPINQALQNMNAQINENSRRQMAAEYQLAQTQLATAKYLGEQADPRLVYAKQQAAEQIKPTVLNIKDNMPNKDTGRFEMERWNEFKPYVANIVGDPGAELRPDGSVYGSDGKPMQGPAWKVAQIKNRINAAQMFEFDEEAVRRGKMRKFEGDIRRLEDVYSKTKDPALKMRIGGMKENLMRMDAEYNNPNRRMISLQGKINKLDRELAKAFTSQNPDKGWVETLKWQQKNTQDEYNALLKAMGKDGKAEGIQLKPYKNPTTGQKVYLPISKFEGAEYAKTNPIAGNVQHYGTFVLDDESPGSNENVVDRVHGMIKSYLDLGNRVTDLKSAKFRGNSNAAFLKANKMEISPDIEAMMRNKTVDPKAVDAQIADLEAAKLNIEKTLRQYEKHPDTRMLLEGFFKEGGVKDDPVGLLETPTGKSKYSGTGADEVLFQP